MNDCGKGHALTPDNICKQRMFHGCRTCWRDYQQAWRAAHPETVAAQRERQRIRDRKRVRPVRKRQEPPPRVPFEPVQQFCARRGLRVVDLIARMAARTGISENAWDRRFHRARHIGFAFDHAEQIALELDVDVATLVSGLTPTRWHERGVAMPDFAQAACDGADTELFFSDAPEAVEQAKTICAGCPIRTDCAEWAVVAEEWGTWGGMTARDRIEERKRRGINMRVQVARCG